MNCKYSFEDIIKLSENSISNDYAKELKMHLKDCKKCKCYYESLELANRFVLEDIPLENDFHNSIMSQVDKTRYLNKKYSIRQLIYKRIPVVKYISAAMACFILVALVLNTSYREKYLNPNNVSSSHETPIISTPIVNAKIYDSINEDINNDNKEDLIELVYDDNLVLKTFNGTFLLDENNTYEHDVMQLPKLQTVRDKNGSKYILATTMFFTNKIGSTAQGWLYDGKKNCVQNVIDVEEIKYIDYEATPLADGKVKLELPEIKVNGIFKLTDEYKDYNYNTKYSIELSSHIDYFVNDYNSDGCEEIITSRRVFMGAVNWFPIYYIYTVYNIIDGRFVPVAYFYDDDQTKRAILKSVFKYGSIKMKNGKLLNIDPLYELSIKDSENAIDEMVNDRVLIKNNNDYYLNIN